MTKVHPIEVKDGGNKRVVSLKDVLHLTMLIANSNEEEKERPRLVTSM